MERAFHVYVVEGRDPKRGRVFYVGQSGKTPEARLREHRERCHRYCPTCKCRHYVEGGSMRLRYEMFARYNPLVTRQEAERVERWLAGRLRRQGYKVLGGH